MFYLNKIGFIITEIHTKGCPNLHLFEYFAKLGNSTNFEIKGETKKIAKIIHEAKSLTKQFDVHL